jgi:hypothetical protein
MDVAAINAHGIAWLNLGMFEEAAVDFRRVINTASESPFVHSTTSALLYNQLEASGKWESSLANRLNPADSAYYNLVMLLAAGPDEVRDGAEARAWAEKLCNSDKNRYYAFQEAFAAAAAEQGDFEVARNRQRRAIALAVGKKKKKELEKRLAMYESDKPYRMRLSGSR